MTETAETFEEPLFESPSFLRGTWLCPRCEDKLCTHGELCDTCQAEDADYADDRSLQEQLRHGG